MKLSLKRPLKWEVYCRHDNSSLPHWKYPSKKAAQRFAGRMNHTSMLLGVSTRRYRVREISQDDKS
jgi:hypothetical protein